MLNRRGSRKLKVVRRSFVALVALVATVIQVAPLGGAGAASKKSKGSEDSVVLRWNEAALEAVRSSTIGPPMVARALAIIHTCAYDAWAAYDAKAVGTRLGGSLRRPRAERTLPNRNAAVSFAAYRAAVDLFPASRATVFDPLMASLGYDPANTTTDTSTAAGVGNVACQSVLDFRHGDGSNQLGDHPAGTPGAAYSDYTGYAPANDPMDLTGPPFDPATVKDPNRWQPLTYFNAAGVRATPAFIAPHWQHVVPFALTSADQLRSATGPATYGSPEFVAQAQHLLDISANLTDEQKVIAEYWADGPRSELPPGHWNLFAQFVSRRDGHGRGVAGLEKDVKLFFALTNAVFDAGIVAWDNKVAYDSVRPITAVRHLFQGQQVTAWAGPGQGTQVIDGSQWLPYQPSWFPTPPFGEYSSGHSNFSAAGAQILKLFTGSDDFGYTHVYPAGSSPVEPGITPAADVTMGWSTFKEAADEAGISRLYGGIHFTQGDLDARATGQAAADQAWAKALAYFDGTAAG